MLPQVFGRGKAPLSVAAFADLCEWRAASVTARPGGACVGERVEMTLGARRCGRHAVTAQMAAVASTSTRNSGLVKPDTITSVEAGGRGQSAKKRSRAAM